jgi:hypothetical protein
MPLSALLRPLSSVQSAVRALHMLLFGPFQKVHFALLVYGIVASTDPIGPQSPYEPTPKRLSHH